MNIRDWSSDVCSSDLRFVANDCRLGDDDRLWLLTGPNMAGKSTFLDRKSVV